MNRLSQTKLFLPFEIVGFALIVSVVLWLLFPENRFEELLKQESGNDLLAIEYIESISESKGLDSTLYETLLQKYISLGMADKALNLLKESGTRYFDRKKVMEREYELLKIKYFSSKAARQVAVKEQIKSILRELVKSSDGWEELLGYYKEAISFSFYDIAKTVVDRGIRVNPSDIDWYRKGMELAFTEGSFKDIEFYLSRLINLDLKNRVEYIVKKAELEASFQEFKKASRTYLELSEADPKNRCKWLEKSALYAKYSKQYIKSSRRYIDAMNCSKNYGEKRRLFLAAIEALRWGRYDKRAAMLIKRYMDLFVKDDRVAKVMLETSLAAGDLKLAHEISLRLMERIK